MESDDKLSILREILLMDDRELAERINARLKKMEETQNNLSERVEPIIHKSLDEFVEEMPKTLGPTITSTLQTEIKKSQDAVAEALYPIMGKMIKKYVQHEVSLLQEKINKQINNTFSFKRWFSSFSGNKSKDEAVVDLMAQQYKAQIEEILVIERDSGILKASYSKTKKIDPDMIAGMLTAIKSFVEDAFQNKEQSLESINYELYTIHLQNFSEYYIAVVLSGIYNVSVKDKLENLLLDFAINAVNKDDIQDYQKFTYKLKEYFSNEFI